MSTLRWDPAVAQARMDNLLSAYYTNKKLDAVLSPLRRPVDRHHLVAQGASDTARGDMKYAGTSAARIAEVQSIKSIIAGEQYSSTIFKDTRDLAKVTVAMIDAIENGSQVPETNDAKTYDNGKKVVPSYLLTPGRRDQGELEAGAGRQRLLQGSPARPVTPEPRPARHRRAGLPPWGRRAERTRPVLGTRSRRSCVIAIDRLA